jgi:D-alanyl-lipoteichoic acid acyltransferase DltB (MBOAT superfamily)
LFGLYFTSSNNPIKKKIGLTISLLLNFGLLFSFKYYNFFTDGLNELTYLIFDRKFIPNYSILLPVGISFYTFQSTSYAIDVYRKNIPAERNLGKFALFISFFPQLVAGPIERAKNLLPQINNQKKYISFQDVTEGVKLIIWGLFIKLVVADNLATLIDRKFEDLVNQTGGALAFVMILFTFQLYCDFSGYSKIAVGVSRLLGFRLMNNFNYPLISSSFGEFWKRWHISLSEWFRDYVYIPLGGSKKNIQITLLNILVVFILSGLWHGATLNFVLWGVLCGVFFIVEYVLIKYIFSQIKCWNYFKAIQIVLIFSLFTFSLVPFRASDLADTWLIYKKIFQSSFGDLYFWFVDNRYSPGIVGLYLFVFIEIWFGLKLNKLFNIKNPITESIFYVLIFFMIILLGKDTGSQFIYFQF